MDDEAKCGTMKGGVKAIHPSFRVLIFDLFSRALGRGIFFS